MRRFSDPVAVLLLDVDGVLNAVGTEPPEGVWPRWERTTSNGFGIIWSPDLVERLLALRDRVEIRWLTTWWADIEKLPFGPEMASLQVACTREEFDLGPLGWWKWPVAQKVAAEGKPVIWVDDDLAFERPAREWVAGSHGRVLGVCPKTTEGITPVQMDAIEAFVAAAARRS